jgi:tRNA A-37 threonylcarbamoyl transferase component Bud32
MALSAGTLLGPYEVLAALGAGGMGEVYRAKDTKLGREVAIKVLPGEVARDPERLARFEREAKLLASLNHPNIAQVYGFESTTLPDSSTSHFLAMELVDGEDLADRLKRPIPVDETIELARQVATALEEAHEKGIVHRDLKPANVKVTPDGKIKVLDFGLAKAWAGDGAVGASSEELSQSPTLTRTGTQAGVILGTAGYMSPEQARGRPVDKRADIWAFGVVLYEMLSGRRLFEGETVTDVLASVVKHPIDWGALPSGTPSALRRLLERCLERDPRKRLRDIGDARIEIEGAPHASVAAGPRAPSRWPSGRIVAAATATLLLGLVAGGVAMRGTRPGLPRPSGKAWHFAVDVGPGLYLNEAFDPSIALPPDGTMLAYSVYGGLLAQELRPRRMDELEAHPLPGTRRANNLFFSPDGQWLAYVTFPDDRLFKVPVEGGKPVDLCAPPRGGGGARGRPRRKHGPRQAALSLPGGPARRRRTAPHHQAGRRPPGRAVRPRTKADPGNAGVRRPRDRPCRELRGRPLQLLEERSAGLRAARTAPADRARGLGAKEWLDGASRPLRAEPGRPPSVAGRQSPGDVERHRQPQALRLRPAARRPRSPDGATHPDQPRAAARVDP